jgi:hypothetical protein
MSTKLEQAMQFVQSGNLASGQSLLAQVIREDPGNEIAWLWLANVLDDPLKKRQCLEKVLQLNPENEQAWRDLAQLESGVDLPGQKSLSGKPVSTEAPLVENEPEPIPDETPSKEDNIPGFPTASEPAQEQVEPTGFDGFWAGLQSVKKEPVDLQDQAQTTEAGIEETLENRAPQAGEESLDTSLNWLSGVEAQPQDNPAEEARGLGSFDDFMQSLKESGEYQGDETWSVEEPDLTNRQSILSPEETIPEESQPVEPEELGWAETDLSRSYTIPDHQEEIRPPMETASVWTTHQVNQPKMTHSQTNIIIALAVITFLVFLVGLGYILWDILPTLR